MEELTTALRQPEYVHVAINHFPLIGLLVAMLALIIALLIRNRPTIFLGLILLALLALSAWPVFEYGEAGYDRVLSMSDDPGRAFLKHHEELAERWVFLYYVTAGLAGLALILGWKRPKTLTPLSLVCVLLAAASLTAGFFIAKTSGEVRHREFRLGPPPPDQAER